ncbi:MAG TPA: GPP34 family phosphoprotein [Microlunatus sp.]|nr:GPP34 family phosphoprotein [Microlunatus sp.]
MLLAEDLLLLLTDDDTGKLAASGTEVDVALGGALLVELALMQRVDVACPDERVREGRLVVRDRDPTGDGLLDEALTIVGQKEGKKPQNVVAQLGKRVRGRLYERLVEGAVLRSEDDRILGIFPRHRWPAKDAAHESSVRAGLVSALREGATAEARTAALISLLLALRAVGKAVDPASVGLSTKELNANAKRLAEGDWAAKAVRQAIDSIIAAIIAATSSAVVVGGGRGTS